MNFFNKLFLSVFLLLIPITQLASLHAAEVEKNFVFQQTNASCSLASATIVLNAILKDLESPLMPAHQHEVLEMTNNETWDTSIREDGDGVDLDQLSHYLNQLFEAYHINAKVNTFHISNDDPDEKTQFFQYLKALNQKTLIIANFEQAMLIPTIPVGHFSPIGAYNQEKGEVLILDVDKEWTGPYWVDQDRLFSALHTYDSDANAFRGYLVITWNKPPDAI